MSLVAVSTQQSFAKDAETYRHLKAVAHEVVSKNVNIVNKTMSVPIEPCICNGNASILHGQELE
jgi:hypothetical protein